MKTIILFFALIFCAPWLKADAYRLSASDKVFYGNLRTAILSNNKVGVATMVAYHIVIQVRVGVIKIRDRETFVANYDEIVTPRVREVVRKQNMDDLAKSWRGVMVGDGEIWFARIKKPNEAGFVYRIIAFNPT